MTLALGYAKPENAVMVHIDAEDKSTTLIQGSAYETRAVTINESGLYSLILSSKLPNAGSLLKHTERQQILDLLPFV